MPLDASKSPDFYVGWAYQTYTIFMSAYTYITIDFFTVSIIMFATAQLEIIAEKLKTVSNLVTRYTAL